MQSSSECFEPPGPRNGSATTVSCKNNLTTALAAGGAVGIEADLQKKRASCPYDGSSETRHGASEMLMREPASLSGFHDPPSGQVQLLAGHASCSTCSRACCVGPALAPSGASNSADKPSGPLASQTVSDSTESSALVRPVSSWVLSSDSSTSCTTARGTAPRSASGAAQRSSTRSPRMRKRPCTSTSADDAPCGSESSTSGYTQRCKYCSWARVKRKGAYPPAPSTGSAGPSSDPAAASASAG
eukprot:scaffold52728_cov69-Phaeocystis_antarctica.AAC.7